MRALIVVTVAVVALVLAVVVLGAIGPVVAVAGVIAALVIVLNPGGIGARIRQSPGWWGFPGMRKASSGAASFAAVLLLYTVPIPLIAFGIVRAAGTPPPVTSTAPVTGIGGGSSASPSAALVTPAVTETPAVAAPTATLEPTPVPTEVPTPVPTAAPTAPPTPRPTARPTAPPTAPPPKNLCGAPDNPWGYNFCGGGTISSPPGDFCSYFNCIASFWGSTKGYVEECADGTYSHSGGRSGSCSHHGGNQRPLNP